MLNLTEETFESTVESVGAGPVTVGAQRKILLSISKLRERYQNLCQLEQVRVDGKPGRHSSSLNLVISSQCTASLNFLWNKFVLHLFAVVELVYSFIRHSKRKRTTTENVFGHEFQVCVSIEKETARDKK